MLPPFNAYDAVNAYDADNAGFVDVNIAPVTYEAVPNKDPVKLLALTLVNTLKDPLIVNDPLKPD
jgi:hypothetical protein